MTNIVERIAGNTPDNGTAQVAVTMAAALAFGVFAVFVSLAANGTVWRGLLWAAAWSSVGWFLGFLFGIPRYLSTDTARRPGAGSLESAKKDLATATANATTLREAANKAETDQGDAEKEAKGKVDAADLAETVAAEARARSDTDPNNPALKADADAKRRDADEARQHSEHAATALTNAVTKTRDTKAAASEADSAAEEANRIVKAGESATASTGSSLTVNTNLEQISDWLTKIIVGVSLVESQALLIKLEGAASLMAKSMSSADELTAMAGTAAGAAQAAAAASAAGATAAMAASAAELGIASAKTLAVFSSMQSLAYAVILYFLATGLLGSYLLTRLFLQRALNDAANVHPSTSNP